MLLGSSDHQNLSCSLLSLQIILAGSLGIVSVSWRVSSSSSVNVSSDVSGVSGGMFTFLSGQTSKEFIVQIHSDNIPESDESLIIELYDAQGGAVIDTASQRATLVIMANDGVGGRIGFSSGSRSKSVAEGENVPLMIYRTAPAAGNVSMNWTIEGVNATRDFLKTSGVVNIPQVCFLLSYFQFLVIYFLISRIPSWWF